MSVILACSRAARALASLTYCSARSANTSARAVKRRDRYRVWAARSSAARVFAGSSWNAVTMATPQVTGGQAPDSPEAQRSAGANPRGWGAGKVSVSRERLRSRRTQALREAGQVEAAASGGEGGPEVAEALHAGGDVVDAKVLDRDAPGDLVPGHRRGDGGAGARAHGVERGQRAA